jgi:hypothetical protein
MDKPYAAPVGACNYMVTSASFLFYTSAAAVSCSVYFGTRKGDRSRSGAGRAGESGMMTKECP